MVDVSYGGTFMLNNEHEAWQLFETLSENSLHDMSTARRDLPMFGPKQGGIYEIESSMDIHSQVDELSQMMNRILHVLSTSTSSTPAIEVCSICSSPSHSIYDCPTAHQFLEFIYEQVNKAQT